VTLSERLREANIHTPSNTCAEAADAIDALMARNKELEGALRFLTTNPPDIASAINRAREVLK
jgi:hypothetical protein